MAEFDSTNCRLCVNKCQSPFKSLYDDKGRPNALYEIIVKYFHPTVLNIDKYKQFTGICRACWRHVWKFCNFQKSVHESQLRLSQVLPEPDEISTESFPKANLLSEPPRLQPKPTPKSLQRHQQRNSGNQIVVQNQMPLLIPDKTLDELLEEEFITIVPITKEQERSINEATLVVKKEKSESSERMMIGLTEYAVGCSKSRPQPSSSQGIAEIDIPSPCIVKTEVELTDNTNSGDNEMLTITGVYSGDAVPEIFSNNNDDDDHKTSSPANEDSRNTSTEAPKSAILMCKSCGRYTKSAKVLQLHTELCHYEGVATEKGVICKLCKSISKSLHGLYTHLFKKHNVSMYKCHCKLCDELFNEDFLFDRHIRYEHGGKIPLSSDNDASEEYENETIKAKIAKLSTSLTEELCEDQS
ncbi:uncharacterized protein LOC106092620 isoform X9 [Stomoxys calcitrans]|uniref:uncharacterized protein LOC106092620 isoform X9 n=1 Tax=Stomoxys calcitrans TaxID=35570 RepID=UPI0027E3077D|nr:uncharacterized protein LOC106092620 isoform X9 [Stomoxys calcitrans]